MRADARRNYDRLLAEADAVFTEYGTDAALDDIARRAGVGIGTLYRHFPSREALVETVLRDRNAELCARADELIGSRSPQEALRTWAREVILHSTTYRGLARSLLECQFDAASDMNAACEQLAEAAGRLVANARRGGAVRADLAADDLISLINAIALAAEQAPEPAAQADRLLDLTMSGLRR